MNCLVWNRKVNIHVWREVASEWCVPSMDMGRDRPLQDEIICERLRFTMLCRYKTEVRVCFRNSRPDDRHTSTNKVYIWVVLNTYLSVLDCEHSHSRGNVFGCFEAFSSESYLLRPTQFIFTDRIKKLNWRRAWRFARECHEHDRDGTHEQHPNVHSTGARRWHRGWLDRDRCVQRRGHHLHAWRSEAAPTEKSLCVTHSVKWTRTRLGLFTFALVGSLTS